MPDDDNNASSQQIDEEQTTDLSPVEQPTQEPVEVVDEQQEETQAEESSESEQAEAPEQPSRRENLRIHQLVSKLKQQTQDQDISHDNAPDYRQMIEADDGVYDQLNQTTQQYGSTQFKEGLKQAESMKFHMRLEMDAPRVASKYPQFDSESEQFNPSLANAVNEWYLASTGYDPTKDTVQNSKIRYSEFVESIMELADVAAGEKVASTTKNIAKQAASTGLRPDGSQAKRLNLNKAPEQMTDEELDAVIAQTIPRK
jgi:hypothetical protein